MSTLFMSYPFPAAHPISGLSVVPKGVNPRNAAPIYMRIHDMI